MGDCGTIGLINIACAAIVKKVNIRKAQISGNYLIIKYI
jgi:hypothetical protein